MLCECTQFQGGGELNAQLIIAPGTYEVQSADRVLARALLQLWLNAGLAGAHEGDGGVNIAADDGVVKAQLGNSLQRTESRAHKLVNSPFPDTSMLSINILTSPARVYSPLPRSVVARMLMTGALLCAEVSASMPASPG